MRHNIASVLFFIAIALIGIGLIWEVVITLQNLDTPLTMGWKIKLFWKPTLVLLAGMIFVGIAKNIEE